MYWHSHVDLMFQMSLASFSSDAFPESRLQAIPRSLLRTVAFAFEPSEVHPNDEEVVELLLAAGARSLFAKPLLPIATAVVACFL